MSRYQKKQSLEQHGVDDWLMTYADMITLLLCFFAIFLSVSTPKQEAMDEVKQEVQEKFASRHKEGARLGDESHAETRSAAPYDKMPSIVDQFVRSETEGEGDVIYLGRKDEGEKKSKKIKPAPEGDRIKTFEIPSTAFFASGSSTISDEGAKLLQGMIDDHLNKEDMKDFIITVEGHTDDAPIATLQFPSNWELSTARAASVVRMFIQKGVDPKRLRAAGYADIMPKLPNRDAAGKPLPAHQAQNRRVVIKLEKVEKD